MQNSEALDGQDLRLSQALRRMTWLAYTLDQQFRIPGTRWRMGLDSIIGLVPGIGDAITALISAYIVLEAWRFGLPKSVIIQMISNILIDAAIGAVPVLGDLFDIAWKANVRNVELFNKAVAG